jgi:hypothetical protein
MKREAGDSSIEPFKESSYDLAFFKILMEFGWISSGREKRDRK